MKKNRMVKVCSLILTGILCIGLFAGCTNKKVDDLNVSDAGLMEESTDTMDVNSSADDSLSSLVGKKNDTQKAEMPEDYDYSLDDYGFVNIGEVSQGLDDNYRNYYEIFVMSFYDSDGDGIGDINGVTEKLDYIKQMGFNGIWLMPVMSSPSYHKYDTSDYYSIDSAYGTNEDFENLLVEAHARDINIVIDFVVNHSSSEHPWFTIACDYLRSLDDGDEIDYEECPYAEYYHFSKENKSGYCQVTGTDWYYEGQFNYTQPDLNFSCEALKNEMSDIIKYWAELGVDGFRVDAAAHFEEGDTAFNNEVLSFIYDKAKEINPDFYMVSEVWLDTTAIAQYYGSGTQSFFNFDAADSTGRIEKTAKGQMSAQQFVERLADYQTTYSEYNEEYIDAVFITNHDMTRVASQLVNDEDAMKMSCGLMMSMQGSTFVYYGEEIGMKSSGSSDENKRIAMYWSDTDLTGIPDGPENADKNIKSSFAAEDEQISDPDSILNYYRRALQLRNANPSLARGQITVVDELTEGNIASVLRTAGSEEILVIYNTDTESASVNLSGTEYENWEICGELCIHPWEDCLLENGSLSMPARSIVILHSK